MTVPLSVHQCTARMPHIRVVQHYCSFQHFFSFYCCKHMYDFHYTACPLFLKKVHFLVPCSILFCKFFHTGTFFPEKSSHVIAYCLGFCELFKISKVKLTAMGKFVIRSDIVACGKQFLTNCWDILCGKQFLTNCWDILYDKQHYLFSYRDRQSV